MAALGITLLRVLTLLLLFAAAAWSVAAIYFSERLGGASVPLAAVLALAFAAAGFGIRGFWRKGAFCVLLFLAVLAWFFMQRPLMHANWQPDVTRLPQVERRGDLITLRNIRNFNYRSETDFETHYYDHTFDLRRLRSADLLLSYWGSPHIAHVMISFGFEPGQYLTFSVETRKKHGQEYSALRGFFRNYELIYIAGDERDLIRLRTNYRGEEVYLYRLAMTPERVRFMLLNYLGMVERLAESPEFYNALIDNCATNTEIHSKAYALGTLPFSWKLMASGHLDEFVYQLNGLNRGLPFEKLKTQSRITPAAQAADQAVDFSDRIRAGLPLLP